MFQTCSVSDIRCSANGTYCPKCRLKFDTPANQVTRNFYLLSKIESSIPVASARRVSEENVGLVRPFDNGGYGTGNSNSVIIAGPATADCAVSTIDFCRDSLIAGCAYVRNGRWSWKLLAAAGGIRIRTLLAKCFYSHIYGHNNTLITGF